MLIPTCEHPTYRQMKGHLHEVEHAARSVNIPTTIDLLRNWTTTDWIDELIPPIFALILRIETSFHYTRHQVRERYILQGNIIQILVTHLRKLVSRALEEQLSVKHDILKYK